MKPTLRHRKVLRDYQTAKARTKPVQPRSFGWLLDYARKIWSVYTARMEP